jgi:uncharacterized small protein (DUF1192 family)
MVQDEDDQPRKRPRLERPLLDTWGVDELAAYIAELRAEIARAEAEVARKQCYRNAADAVFRRPG